MTDANCYALREAIPADIEAITDLVNRAFAIERFFKSSDRTNPAQVTGMMHDGKFLLLTSVSRVLACVFVQQHQDRMYAGLLALDPDWKVSGTGARMMDETENYARAAGCKWIDIHIVSVRPELRRLYRKRGFVETGTEPAEDLEGTDRPVHFITMSKPL
jgi:N-acetylglutamate synthase-like GNAT family acetyltransferase